MTHFDDKAAMDPQKSEDKLPFWRALARLIGRITREFGAIDRRIEAHKSRP